MPDVFSGDPVPVEVLLNESFATFDFPTWIGKHNDATTLPILDKVIDALKKDGVTSLGATGYCFGGQFTEARLSSLIQDLDMNVSYSCQRT